MRFDIERSSHICLSSLGNMQDVNDEIEIFLSILFMLIETLRHDVNLATDLGRSIFIDTCFFPNTRYSCSHTF
jgi:hypothetical protein